MKKTLLFLTAVVLLISLCGCGTVSQEPQGQTMHVYYSLDEYFQSNPVDGAEFEPPAVPNKLPEGAEFKKINRKDTYVHTIYSYPYREDLFGPAEDKDEYEYQQVTRILYERWLPGTTEEQKASNDQIIQSEGGNTVTVNGTEYGYKLIAEENRYYFSYIDSDAGAIFVGIPAIATPEELVEYLDVYLAVP
ncbi:MAG: hypothetical protein IKZ19_01625 [Clostridia bacterium]|nr:hypothetical protein [Clostridia bacterium]